MDYVHFMPDKAEDELDPFEYRLLARFIRLESEGISKWQGFRQLAIDTKMSVNKTRDAYKSLVDKGFVEQYVKDIGQQQLNRVKRPGYVYLIQSPTNAYKIGRTINPADRIHTFSVKLPFEVEYLAVIPTDDMHQLETNLHARFADQRIDGEWFDLSDEDVAYIKSLEVGS